jgi:hypothetical protein
MRRVASPPDDLVAELFQVADSFAALGVVAVGAELGGAGVGVGGQHTVNGEQDFVDHGDDCFGVAAAAHDVLVALREVAVAAADRGPGALHQGGAQPWSPCLPKGRSLPAILDVATGRPDTKRSVGLSREFRPSCVKQRESHVSNDHHKCNGREGGRD